MKYVIEDLTKEEAEYISGKINEIVPHEVDADEEEFVLKIENENGEIIGGCVAEAYEYHWSRMFLDTLWVDERYRHQGLGSMIIREAERIAREKGCRVVTLGTASYMARPFYEKHGYTVFTTLKKPSGYISYSLCRQTTAAHDSGFHSAMMTMRMRSKTVSMHTAIPMSRNTRTQNMIRNLWIRTESLRCSDIRGYMRSWFTGRN